MIYILEIVLLSAFTAVVGVALMEAGGWLFRWFHMRTRRTNESPQVFEQWLRLVALEAGLELPIDSTDRSAS